MTAPPFNPAPNGVPAPGQGSFPMPPGQATFQAPMPAQPAAVVQERQWQGYPVSQLPPMPAPGPTQQPFTGQPQPQYQQSAPQQQAPVGWPQSYQQPQASPQPPQQGQWQPGMLVPTQHAQPQTQPGQQFQQSAPQQQAPQGPPGVDVNTVLQGPQFPQELQGVTLGQAITMYGGMRNLILSLQQRQQQQVMAPGPQQQQASHAPQLPAPQAGQQQAPAPFDWRNPGPGIAAVVAPLIAQALDERLAPVTQQAHLQGAANARGTVAQEIGAQRFAQLEPHVIRLLQGAAPSDLANPELWRVAVRTAAGELALNGQLGAQAPQTLSQQYGGAVQFRPGMQNPAPPLQSFFSEAPQTGGQAVQGVSLNPQQMWFADQMGISYADYAAYAGGIPSQLPANGGRR